MAERLEQIAREADPLQNPFLNRRAAEIFGGELREALAKPGAASAPAKMVGLHYKCAYELLNAGESEKAVQQFLQLIDFMKTNRIALTGDKAALVRMNAATAPAPGRTGELPRQSHDRFLHHADSTGWLSQNPARFARRHYILDGAS